MAGALKGKRDAILRNIEAKNGVPSAFRGTCFFGDYTFSNKAMDSTWEVWGNIFTMPAPLKR